MLKRCSLLLVGLLLGFFLSRLFTRPTVPAPYETSAKQDQPALPESPSIQKEANVIRVEPESNLPQKRPKEEEPKIVEAPPKQINQQHELTISFDEKYVDLLEMQGSGIRDWAYTNRTSDGWKIFLTEPQSLFSEMGIRDGDFISKAAVSEVEGSTLRNRITQIFDRLER